MNKRVVTICKYKNIRYYAVNYLSNSNHAVEEGIDSILRRETCVVIMMGEQDENSIQTNLESYNNLDQIIKDLEKTRSFISIAPTNRLAQNNLAKAPLEVPNVKTIFTSQKLIEKNKRDKMFLETRKKPSISVEVDDPIEKIDQQLEEAIKDELKSRRNPLKLLGIYINRIKRLCDKLKHVGLLYCQYT